MCDVVQPFLKQKVLSRWHTEFCADVLCPQAGAVGSRCAVAVALPVCSVCACVCARVMWYYWLPCVHNVSTDTFGVVAIQHLQLLEEAVNLIRLFIVPAFD